jgi:osmotically-inducible protein OsmY
VTNHQLRRDVYDELAWDPKVDSEGIAVSVDDATVTLRGTVGSFRRKREAQKAAERVNGVSLVDNHLVVRILTRREDADLCAYVQRALRLDVLVPATVDVTVEAGFVTLIGTVAKQCQRDEAAFVAGNVRGVTGVRNDLSLTSGAPLTGDVRHWIKKALVRNSKLDADSIGVRTVNGTVILTGTVACWAERDSAVAAAWAAPGVIDVDDRLELFYY